MPAEHRHHEDGEEDRHDVPRRPQRGRWKVAEQDVADDAAAEAEAEGDDGHPDDVALVVAEHQQRALDRPGRGRGEGERKRRRVGEIRQLSQEHGPVSLWVGTIVGSVTEPAVASSKDADEEYTIDELAQ